MLKALEKSNELDLDDVESLWAWSLTALSHAAQAYQLRRSWVLSKSCCMYEEIFTEQETPKEEFAALLADYKSPSSPRRDSELLITTKVQMFRF